MIIVQWNTHRLLHKVPFLWEVHKVHHSVREMGYAAHLRYHFGETIVYRTIEYIPLAIISFWHPGIPVGTLVHDRDWSPEPRQYLSAARAFKIHSQ